MKSSRSPRIRRSVALPRTLVEEATRAAPRELRDNLNRLVIAALEEYVVRRKATAFDEAMAHMADDPAIRQQITQINGEFGSALLDGLRND